MNWEDGEDGANNVFGEESKACEQEQADTYDFLLLGDSGTGKTAFTRFLKDKIFESRHIKCRGIQLVLHSLELDDKRIQTNLWDPGVEDDRREQPHLKQPTTFMYYRNISGVFLFFDVNTEETLHSCVHWMREVAQVNGSSHFIPLLLIGAKCDQRTEKEEEEEEEEVDSTGAGPPVDYLTAKAFAEDHKIQYIETSSKDGANIELALLTMLTLARTHQ